jgi:transglutaminase-like putative cysteine protease
MDGGMDGRIRIACAAWLATLAAACALLPLVDGADWLIQAAVLLAAQSGAGMLLRWRGVLNGIVVIAQAATSLVLLTAVAVPGHATAGVLPGPAAFDRFGQLLSAGAEDIGHYVAPAPATDGIRLMIFGGVLLIGLIVDQLAVPLRSAAAAGLPLLALYSVAAGVAQDASGWPYFACAAAGYLVLLLAEGRDRLGKWGRFLSGPGHGHAMTAHDQTLAATPRARAGRRIGAVTLGIAVLAPALLPSLGEGLFDLDEGSGSGSGAGGFTAVNPVVSLQDQLTQPENRTALTYRSDGPAPGEMYLRLTALDQFTGEEWRSSGWHENRIPPSPWPVPGLSTGVAITSVTTTIVAENTYAQSSLPVPYPARGIEIGSGDTDGWLYDRGSQTLVSGSARRTSAGLTYQVEHLVVEPTREQLVAAPEPPEELQEYYTRLPDSLPSGVVDIARQVTRGAANDYERATALQDWFAREGGFRYDTSVASGSGSDAIVNFLNQKEGFCVHFAFSMATMARSLGIPAQVAVGFTPGGLRSGDYYEVGIHNAHAWPELYFEGVGWVRFEPTPGQGSVPQYARPESDTPDQERPEEPREETGPSPTVPGPSASPTVADRCDPSVDGSCENEPRTPESDDDQAGLPFWPVLWTGGGLLALAVLGGPLLWRVRARSRRLAPEAGPLAAWRELNDTAWDFGIAPQSWETPRQIAGRVVRVADLPQESAAAVLRVATAVEEELYAPRGARPERKLAHDVRAASAGLRATAGRWARLRALLLPRSAVRVMQRASERQLAAGTRIRAGLAGVAARRPWRRV